MDGYDWFGFALAVAGWMFLLWLAGWNPMRLVRFTRGAVPVLLSQVSKEPVEPRFQHDVDETMAYFNSRAAKVPHIDRWPDPFRRR